LPDAEAKMDKRSVDARVEMLFHEAKPKSKPNKKGYLKLDAVLMLATIPLTITQLPSSLQITEAPIIPAVPWITPRQTNLSPRCLLYKPIRQLWFSTALTSFTA
jgi:hypothetical protein